MVQVLNIVMGIIFLLLVALAINVPIIWIIWKLKFRKIRKQIIKEMKGGDDERRSRTYKRRNRGFSKRIKSQTEEEDYQDRDERRGDYSEDRRGEGEFEGDVEDGKFETFDDEQERVQSRNIRNFADDERTPKVDERKPKRNWEDFE